MKAYFAPNRDHADLLPSPWCLKNQVLVLPKLPDRKAELTAQRAETRRALEAMGYNVVEVS